VLDGLLYHESDLRIEEHYTDTAGFTDHVFGLMHLLGFRFAPRIRDLGGQAPIYPRRRQAVPDARRHDRRQAIDVKHIRAHWDEILRLASSIRQGTVTASLMLRKLGSYPRQNGLAVALRELGRIERTLFRARLDAKRRTSPARANWLEQGRSQECAGPSRILQPAWRNP
jgi:TnpA family transposase